jgi:hypothetical protein
MRLSALSFVVLLIVPAPALGQDLATETETEPDEAEASPRDCSGCTALGELPPADGIGKPWWAWIRMRTGETFGGDFHGVHHGVLKINSDEVGDLDLNFYHVWELVTQRAVTVVRNDHRSYVGLAEMRDNETIVVHTADGDVSVPKADILSINTGGGDELSNWYFKLAVGFNLTDATIDQLTLNSLTRINRDGDVTRLTLSHDMNYGVTEDAAGMRTDTSNNMWGLAKFDYFVSRVFYLTLASVHAGYDRLQNTAFRITPGAGAGVHILDGGPDFDVELSGAYLYTTFDTVMAGEDDETQGGGGGYRLYFDWDIIKGGLGLTLEHRGFIIYAPISSTTNDFSQSTFRTQVIIDIDIMRFLDLDVSFAWDRVLEPQLAQDGSRPQADTITLAVDLGIEFGS